MQQEQTPTTEELMKNSESVLAICERINKLLDMKEAQQREGEYKDE